LAACKDDGDNPTLALTVFYGQRHSREIDSARKISEYYALEHVIIDLGNSFPNAIKQATALINKEENLPAERRMSEMTAKVPRTYVPARNTVLLSIALSVAEAYGLDQICCGVQATDYASYPDTRRCYIEAFNHLARFATKRGYENNPILVKAPIVDMSKASVVNLGLRLKVPFEFTWTCYEGGERPCGRCDSCIIRANAFWANGVDDPLMPYIVTPMESF
jgi:7-cyano-7-deazaguanine synthase